MKRSYLTNLLLLTLMMVLLWQLDHVQTPQAVTTIGGDLQANTVEKITVERPQNRIEISKNQQGWQIQQPFTAPASDSRINMLLSLLDTVPGEQFTAQGLDLAEFGLAEPSLTLIFNDTPFAFGDTERLSDQRYLLADDTIYLFNDTVSPLLQASASGFIENRLFHSSGKLQSLTIPYRSGQRLQTQTLTLQLQDGRWQSADNIFSTDALTAVANAWQQAYAMQVSANDAAPGADFQRLQFGFDSGESLQAYARLSAQGLSVLVPDWQLQYQFPASTANGLFPADNETD